MTDKPHPHQKLYDAFAATTNLLVGLNPEDRATLMDWLEDYYCRGCGYPAPPLGESCNNCGCYRSIVDEHNAAPPQS